VKAGLVGLLSATAVPGGPDWFDRDGVVLRTVTSCTANRDAT
jgi:hypothetical protein